MALTDGELAYRMQGYFLEFCDCYTICPCWVGRGPDDGRCTGAFGWLITRGNIDGIKVDGIHVVSVSFHSGHRDTGGQEVFLFIDERASEAQFDVLAAAFTGRAGGPLGELSTLMGLLRGTDRAAIDLGNNGDFATITVDHRISGDAKMLRGADGQVTELSHSRMSQVLGTTAEVGTSAGFRVDLGGQGFSMEVKGRAAMRGKFRYQHTGGAR